MFSFQTNSISLKKCYITGKNLTTKTDYWMNFCIAGYLRIKSSPNNAIWFLKTNFLEVIKYFRPSIGATVQRSFYPCGLSKLKKLRGCQRGAYILVWQRVWIMKLLNDSIRDPLKQTKRSTLWCFAVLTIINWVSGNCFLRFSGKSLKQTERLKIKGIPVFLVGNTRPKFGYHVFKPFLNISFTLCGRFSLNETDLGKW